MTVPGNDPNYPPYGWGDGTSPEAVGPAAFETPPEPNIDVRTDPDWTRRHRKSNSQELGRTIPNMAAHQETPAAAIQPPLPQDRHPFTGTSTIVPPDDQNTAATRVTQ